MRKIPQVSPSHRRSCTVLWDGDKGDGPGGTGDLVEKVQRLGGRNEIINTKQLFKL